MGYAYVNTYVHMYVCESDIRSFIIARVEGLRGGDGGLFDEKGTVTRI